jgi:hypothetical protein
MSIEAIANQRRATWLAVALLLLLPFGWLGSCVFGSEVFVPFDLAASPPMAQQLDAAQLLAARANSNYDVTEVPIWFLPEIRLARRIALGEGRFPAWNAEARGGSSLHGHGEDGLLYPPNWLALFAEQPEQWLFLLCYVSLIIAGLGAFFLLRAVQLSVPAALFGGITFQLSGVMAANAFFCWRLASLCWLPVLLWSLVRMADRTARARLLPGCCFAIAFAATWLAGFPVYASSNCLVAAIFGLVLLVREWRQSGRLEALRLFAAMSACAIVGVLLALPQVLPSVLFFAQSARNTTPTIAELGTLACDPAGLLGYLVPDLFGNPAQVMELPYDRSPLWLLLSQPYTNSDTPQPRYYNATEYSVFAGSLGLLFVLLGRCSSGSKYRRVAIGFLCGMLLLALFVPGVRLLLALPVFNHVHPFRWLASASIFVAWLAADGCERLCQARPSRVWLLASLSAILAICCAGTALLFLRKGALVDLSVPAQIAAKYQFPLDKVVQFINDGGDRFAAGAALAAAKLQRSAFWLFAAALVLGIAPLLTRRPRLKAALPWVCCALAAVELLMHGHGYAHGRELVGNGWTTVHEFLAREQRASGASGGIAIARAAKVAGLPDQLPTGMLLPSGVRDMHFDTHYDAHSHQPWQRLFGDATAQTGHLTLCLPDDERLQHPVLDALGVTHLLSTELLQHAGEQVFTLAFSSGSFYVYRRPHALKRAFVVGQLQVLPNDASVLATMVPFSAQGVPLRTGIEWQPAQTALITAADAAAMTETKLAPLAAERKTSFATDESGLVEIDVTAGAAGLLVVSDTYMPGWDVAIDGAPAKLLRVDHALRGVQIPANACRVRFTYAQPGLAVGFALCIVGALALFTLAAVGFHARRTKG